MRNPERAVQIAYPISDDDEDGLYRAMTNVRSLGLRCDVYYVSPDVTTILNHAALALAPEHHVHFQREDFPSRQGFIMLDGDAYDMPTWGGGTQRLQALFFVRDTKRLGIWSVISDTADRANDVRLFGGVRFRHALNYVYGEPIVIDEASIDTHPDEWTQDSPEEQRRLAKLAVDAVDRWLYAWAQFVKQEIVYPERTQVPRADRRRAERAGEALPTLNVVLLRRVAHPQHSDGESEVAWTHRWMVSGHWRNQPYGPRDAPSHRAQWINGYVKGPDGLPLVVKERVTSIIR